jgi:hypothetical protein
MTFPILKHVKGWVWESIEGFAGFEDLEVILENSAH